MKIEKIATRNALTSFTVFEIDTHTPRNLRFIINEVCLTHMCNLVLLIWITPRFIDVYGLMVEDRSKINSKKYGKSSENFLF